MFSYPQCLDSSDSRSASSGSTPVVIMRAMQLSSGFPYVGAGVELEGLNNESYQAERLLQRMPSEDEPNKMVECSSHIESRVSQTCRNCSFSPSYIAGTDS